MSQDLLLRLGVAGAAQVPAAVKQADDAVKAYDDRVRKAADGSELLSGRLGGLVKGAAGLIVFNAAAGYVRGFGNELLQAKVRAENLQTTLEFAAARPAATELRYLRETTNALGLEFVSTAKSYASFSAAARGTKLEGEETRKVFEAVAKASSVMGLSAADNQGVLLALSQMMSKGKVSAEELRGQLGERLPGAFQIAALAMGLTTAQLDEMLVAGTLLSDDFLPRFAAQLDTEFAGAAEKAANRTEAALNRTANAWERLKQAVSDSGAGNAAAGQVGGLGYVMNNVADAMEQARANGSGFTGQMVAATGAALRFFSPMASIADQTRDFKRALEGAEKDLALLQDKLAANPESIMFRSAIAETQAYIRELREAERLQRQLDQSANETNRLARSAPGYGDQTSAEDSRLKRRADQAVEQGKVFAKYATDAQKLRTELDAVRVAFDGVIPPDLERQIREKFVRPTGDSIDGYVKLYSEVQKNLTALQDEATTGEKVSKAAQKRTELARGLVAEYNKLTLAQKRSVMMLVDEWEEQEHANEAMKKAVKLAADRAAARTKENEGIDAFLAKQAEEARAGLKSVEDRIQALKDEQEAAYLAAADNISLATAVEEVALARLREKAARYEEGSPAYEAVQREIAARRQLLGLVASGEARKAQEAALNAMAADAQRVNDQIGQSLADALMQGGQNAWDYIKGMVRAQVLRPVVVMAAQGVTGTIQSALGMPTSPGGSGSGLFSGVNPFNVSNAFDSFATSGFGQRLGLSTLTEDAAGNIFAQTSQGVAQFGQALSAAGDALGYLNAVLDFKNGNYGAAAGSAIGTYVGGPVGAAIGRTVGAVVDKVFKGNAGTPHLGGYAAIGSDGKINTAFGAGESNRSAQMDAPVLQLVSTLNTTLNATARAFGQAADFATTGVFKSDSKDPSWAVLQLLRGSGQVGGFRAEGTLAADPTKGFEEFSNQAAASVRQALQAMDLPGWAQDVLGQIGDSATVDQIVSAAAGIAQTATAIKDLQAQLLPLGGVFQRIGELSSDATFKLGEAAGGLGNLNSQLETYYANFYTDAERTAMGLQRVGAELATVGLEVPRTRAEFRALVESFGAAGGITQEQLSSLLKVGNAFAELVPAAESAAAAVGSYTDKLNAAIETALPKFLTDEQMRQRSYDKISASLQAVGIVAGTDALRSFTKTQIFEFANAYVSSAANADSAKLAVVEAASALADLADAAGNLTDSVLEDIRQFNAQLGFGDLSPLNPVDQLAAARNLFDSTVARAQGGDAAARGQLVANGRALIEEARSFYGSAAGSAAIFDLVRNQLGQFLPENQALVGPFNPGYSPAANPQLEAVASIQTGLQQMEATAAQGRDEQSQLMREQLARAQVMIENQAAQIEQQAAIAAQMLASLQAIDARAAQLVAKAEEAALQG